MKHYIFENGKLLEIAGRDDAMAHFAGQSVWENTYTSRANSYPHEWWRAKIKDQSLLITVWGPHDPRQHAEFLGFLTPVSTACHPCVQWPPVGPGASMREEAVNPNDYMAYAGDKWPGSFGD